MKRPSSVRASWGADPVYASIALVAAILTVVATSFTPWVIAAVVLALVPWVLILVGVRVPHPLFAVLAIAPVTFVVAATGIGMALFLAFSAASRVASRSDRRWLVAVLTAVVILLPFVPFALGDEADFGAVYFAFGGVFSMLVGILLRRSTRLADELRQADAELAAAGARDERHRIARDVHDLVAHSLTVVVLHVGGARRVLRADPSAAERALTDAERVSRESLDAIRGVVGLLRDHAELDVPSLDLERLVTTYRSAGLSIALRIEGDPESMPLAVRVTVYRVVQEALANAARHSAQDAPTRVDVAIDPVQVVARITNRLDDPPAAQDSDPGGYGLLGLREQSASLGGELVSGRAGDQWVVECSLPLRSAP